MHNQAIAQERFKIGRDAPEAFEFKILAHDGGSLVLRMPRSSDHEIFVGVFGSDKLDHIGAIAHDLQDQGAKRIGQNVAEAMFEDAVVEDRAERLYCVQLLLQMMVTAGRAEDQVRLVLDALKERFIGSGVTSV